MGWDVVLRAAWTFRFPLLLLLFCCSLYFGYRYISYQNKKIDNLKESVETAQKQAKDMEEANDKLQAELVVREQVRIAREEESNKRWQDIKRRLDNAEAKAWAATPLPASLRGLSMVLPDMPSSSTNPASITNSKTSSGR